MPLLRVFFLFFILFNFSFSQQDATVTKETSYYKKQELSKTDLQEYKKDHAFNYEIKPRK
ncbi:hypothetical protein N7U66_06535 [Lacinutrix neustonica]|uniref:Uncharacterized protein n=1 Tax=Lacinutrix neustonica TaxID=2980107 RepID=A0A9E8MY92_9FLAO|nr:hypothetical protein [Lacinutrix neustonica]WAC03226.1 hypothetical protein N7U66_06535 [Lacinutrix neustonica]